MTHGGAARVAVVTGACGGLGRDIAARLADDGCSVAAFDVRDTPPAAALRARRAITFFEVDVASRAALEHALEQVRVTLGTPSILVNCAAVLTRAPFLDLTDADWDTVLNVNLRGTFLSCQLVARGMVGAGLRGRIVNISSNSQVMATPLAAHYAASKGGIFSLTRTMAFELAAHGITANVICPGPVLTDMNRDAFADPAYRAQREQTIPIGRLGQPADVTALVAFLASEASDFMTGATLFVDGGQTLRTSV